MDRFVVMVYTLHPGQACSHGVKHYILVILLVMVLYITSWSKLCLWCYILHHGKTSIQGVIHYVMD